MKKTSPTRGERGINRYHDELMPTQTKHHYFQWPSLQITTLQVLIPTKWVTFFMIPALCPKHHALEHVFLFVKFYILSHQRISSG